VLVTFDAALRETCVVRQSRTNTPLQALALMNDVTFVEASRAVAQRAMREADGAEARVGRIFRLVLAREPRPTELRVLTDGLKRNLSDFHSDPTAARKLIGVGESRADASLDPAELASYTATASLILNLDETITRE
jgi:hypothetical protein